MDEIENSERRRFPGMLNGLLPFIGKPKEQPTSIDEDLEEKAKTVQYRKINEEARAADWLISDNSLLWVMCVQGLCSVHEESTCTGAL